ncbi:NAD(P)/FAD-dependent oxidoreductase [Xanthobacteraceae bacterium Astr-EGSB]|uniref:FCSD flavin-binding domain-containing protein n=1 Tax=Astrobacterium formosum TaxID=3069710 RepID=UPI0027B6FD7E|nr:NAD(P)/FAD-dependent oxidoreductase [Xanthobacteraceae bacterium Astr-EGSB]
MTELTRRRFGILTGASFAAASTPLFAPHVLGQGKPKLVVIGGGAGGGTLARYVAKDSNGAVDVTLIEPQKNFTTCFFSNLYVGGLRSFKSITHDYDKVKKSGVKVIHAAAMAIDRDKKQVVLAGGQRITYDRLAVAPGIDLKFDSVHGYSEAAAELMPHAWKPGKQTELLVKKLNALKDGDTIVMIAPPNPYRCPPGPYERASMFAHVLKTKGHKKSRIIILDVKPNFSKQALFMEGWEKHYPGMIEWQDPNMHGGIKSVNPKTGEIVTDLGSYKAALANVIPAQMAGKIARDAGLADASGFCPIDPDNMKSKMDPNVFVVGDASIAGDMPKSAFSANSQAKVAAMIVRSELTSSRAFPARYNNTCWSLIAPDDDVKVGGAYEPGEGKIKASSTFVSQKAESSELRKQNYQESVDWYNGIVADIFG